MSIRSRLRLFFGLIVIVPMIALGIVLFASSGAARRVRPTSGYDRAGLIAAADAALYAAKRGGKNRVERAAMAVAEPSSPPR